MILKAGYEWYQDHNFSYRIGYPENWETSGPGVANVTVNNVSGKENTISFQSPSLTYDSPHEAYMMVAIYQNPYLAKWWTDPKISLEQLKKDGKVSTYGNITINGREGFEVIYDGGMMLFGRRTYNMRMIEFDDTPHNLYYQITVWAFSSSESGQIVDLYDKYNSTFNDIINSFVIES